MITSALLDFLDWAVSSLLSALPDAPSWLQGVGADVAVVLQSILNGAAQWSFIVPFEALALSFQIAVASWALSIVLRAARIVLSYLTLGGGM